MRNKRHIGVILFALLARLAAAAPWASIAYAEGKSFMLVRDGKTSTFSVDSAGVFGMELRQGDILQTASSTFLEIYVTSIKTSIQVAENTSFKCDSDKTGEQVTGELYYGRVRAKVTKLVGASSFRITTPTLVAGVRGTDFGCDVIAVRSAKSTSTPILNRVFCFEGSVAVVSADTAPDSGKTAAKTAPVEPVVITKNEMIENVVSSDASAQADTVQAGAAQAAPALVVTPLVKSAISDEVSSFWLSRPFADVAQAFPAGRIEEAIRRNLKVPAGASTALIVLGTAACIGSSWYSEHVDSGGAFVAPVYSAGIVMAGSGSILALISALSD